MWAGPSRDSARAIALAVAACVGVAPVIAEAPPVQLIKPVAVCDETRCTLSKADWDTFVQFHSAKFQAMQEANEMLEAARDEIGALRALLARVGGDCRGRRRT